MFTTHLLHELPDDLVSYLVTPLVDDRHVDVINEHRHLLTARRPVRGAHSLLYVAFYGRLGE